MNPLVLALLIMVAANVILVACLCASSKQTEEAWKRVWELRDQLLVEREKN